MYTRGSLPFEGALLHLECLWQYELSVLLLFHISLFAICIVIHFPLICYFTIIGKQS